MIIFYSMLRTPFGQMSNRVQGSPAQKPSHRLPNQEVNPAFTTFFRDIRQMVDQCESELQRLYQCAKRGHSPLLQESLLHKQRQAQGIKERVKTHLGGLLDHSFIDKQMFLTSRPTGTIQIMQNSSDIYKVLGTKERYYNLSNVRGLKLANVILTEFDVKEIAKTLPHLEELTLHQCAIDNEGAKIVARGLSNLTKLSLEWNQIGNEGAAEIAHKLKKLQSLNLYLNDVSDEGAKVLVNNLKCLKTLNLENNNLSADMQRYLQNTIGSYKLTQ